MSLIDAGRYGPAVVYHNMALRDCRETLPLSTNMPAQYLPVLLVEQRGLRITAQSGASSLARLVGQVLHGMEYICRLPPHCLSPTPIHLSSPYAESCHLVKCLASRSSGRLVIDYIITPG